MARSFRLFTIIALSIIGTVSVTAQTRPATSDFKVKYRVTYVAGGQPHSSESVTMIKGARERSENRMGQGFDMTNITQCDLKVKYRVTYVAGGQPHSSESVTMIKGARERSENRMGQGFDMTNITQCDLKRTIQINDSVRKYSITPMETDSSTSPSPGPGTTPAPASATPSRTGGTVTYVTSSIDTGERREMFGFTARHVKSVTTIQSSPDACNPVNQRTEIDGWYIDLNVAFDCNQGRPPSDSYRPRAAGGCRDQTKFRREGNGKLGYPLIETMRMMDASGQITFSTTKEVLELSRE